MQRIPRAQNNRRNFRSVVLPQSGLNVEERMPLKEGNDFAVVRNAAEQPQCKEGVLVYRSHEQDKKLISDTSQEMCSTPKSPHNDISCYQTSKNVECL